MKRKRGGRKGRAAQKDSVGSGFRVPQQVLDLREVTSLLKEVGSITESQAVWLDIQPGSAGEVIEFFLGVR